MRSCIVLFVLVAASLAVDARPYRGSIKWSVVLCAFKNAGAPPRTKTFYEGLIVNGGTGGLADFWNSVSYGSINMQGTVVTNWYNMSMTKAESLSRSRSQIWTDCKNTAASAPAATRYTVPAGQLAALITYPDRDMYGWPGNGAYLPWNVDVGGLGHETGHGLGFEHSWSNDPTYRNADWATIGEYDDMWDTMSYAHVYSTPAPVALGGSTGPSLNAYHQDRMGWLPSDMIMRFGADGAIDATVTIQANNRFNPAATYPANTYLLVRVPYNASDVFQYYTIEYRRKVGLDAAIPSDYQLLLHQVKPTTATAYGAVLQRNLAAVGKPAATSLSANGVTISLLSTSGDTATVRIQSAFAKTCKAGYVWRGACATDTVCVTGTVRTATLADNAAAAGRVVKGTADSCTAGYVWREACGATDHVCVTPATRLAATQDNTAAASRVDNLAAKVYGPNTCANGYVWREADSRDWVCVTGAVRVQTKADNAAKALRWVNGAYGPHTCVVPYAWRGAFPRDDVCVLGDVKNQVAADNAAAGSRLMKAVA